MGTADGGGARSAEHAEALRRMGSSKDLAAWLAGTLEVETAALRAVPDGPDTARPNRPSGRGWSQREELGHCIDSAVNNHNRFVRAALEPSYAGPGYAENPWVEVHGYRDLPWTLLVDAWAGHNALLVPLVARIPDAKLSTPCAVGGSAPVTLGFLVDEYVLHMKHHLDQVLRRPVVTKYPRG